MTNTVCTTSRRDGSTSSKDAVLVASASWFTIVLAATNANASRRRLGGMIVKNSTFADAVLLFSRKDDRENTVSGTNTGIAILTRARITCGGTWRAARGACTSSRAPPGCAGAARLRGGGPPGAGSRGEVKAQEQDQEEEEEEKKKENQQQWESQQK